MRYVIGLLALVVSFGVMADTKDTVWITHDGTIASTSISDSSVRALAAWRYSWVTMIPEVDQSKCGSRIVVETTEHQLITRAIDNQRNGEFATFLIEHGNAPNRGGCVLRGIRFK